MAQIISSELLVSTYPLESGRQLRWGDSFEIRWVRQGGLLNAAAGRPIAQPQRSSVKICIFGKRGGSEDDRRQPVLLKQVFEQSDRGVMTVTLPAETRRNASWSDHPHGLPASPSTQGIRSCWVVVACISGRRGAMEAGRSLEFPVLGQGDQFWQVRKPVLQSSAEAGWHLVVRWQERTPSEAKVDAVSIALKGCNGASLTKMWQGDTGMALLQLPDNLPTCLGYQIVIESVQLGDCSEEAIPLRGTSKSFGIPSTRASPVTCFRCRCKYGDAAMASAALSAETGLQDTLSNRDGARAVAAGRRRSSRRSPRASDSSSARMLKAEQRNSCGWSEHMRGSGKGSPRSVLDSDHWSCSSSEAPSTPHNSDISRSCLQQPQTPQQADHQYRRPHAEHNLRPAHRPVEDKCMQNRPTNEPSPRRKPKDKSQVAKPKERMVSASSDNSLFSAAASGGHMVTSVNADEMRQWARRKDRAAALTKAMFRHDGASPSKLKSEPSINRRIATAVANGNIMDMTAADMDGMLPNEIDHDQPIAVLLPEESDLHQRFAAAIACGNVVDMSSETGLNGIIPNVIDHSRPAAILM